MGSGSVDRVAIRDRVFVCLWRLDGWRVQVGTAHQVGERLDRVEVGGRGGVDLRTWGSCNSATLTIPVWLMPPLVNLGISKLRASS